MKPNIALVAIVALLSVTPAMAADDQALTTAREVAKEGLDAYDAGRYEEAVGKLTMAYDVVHLPTVGVYAARALAKTGRWVKASEVYLDAMRIKPTGSWPGVQSEAQINADRERTELLPRIPRLAIQLEGAKIEEVTVSIDGVLVPSALLAAEQLVDPGQRHVVGKRGTEEVAADATLKEAERQSVTLRFAMQAPVTAPIAPAIAPPLVAPPPQPLVTSAPPPPNAAPPADSTSGANTQRLLGWVGIGVGSAGLAFGGITGILTLSKHSDLKGNGCTDTSCYADQQSDVDAHNRLRTMSIVGFVAGGVIAASGVTLLLTAPKSQEARAAAASGATSDRGRAASTMLTIGPGSVAVAGRF
jgi:hypothetical protein